MSESVSSVVKNYYDHYANVLECVSRANTKDTNADTFCRATVGKPLNEVKAAIENARRGIEEYRKAIKDAEDQAWAATKARP
jgi:hypothetical protein